MQSQPTPIPINPLEVLGRADTDPQSLKPYEKLVFTLYNFDLIADMEGWDHFFTHEHHFAWYDEMKHWLDKIDDIPSLSLLEEYENHLATQGVEVNPAAINEHLCLANQNNFETPRDWRNDYSELRPRRWNKANFYLQQNGYQLIGE